MEPTERFLQLLDKYKQATLAEAEANELAVYIQSGRFTFWLEEDVRESFEAIDTAATAVFSHEKAYEILLSVLAAEAEKKRVAKPFSFRKTWWWAAAAVLAAAVATGIFNTRQQQYTGKVTAAAAAAIVEPGSNRAVLTLSNGTTVQLDSNGNRLIQEGQVAIRQKEGQLNYSSRKEVAVPAESYNTLTTPLGGQYRLVLPDGTKVWLNAGSSITYPVAFTGERKVTVTGEVYFEVIHNNQLPFRVQVKDQVIEDIGTAFNINAYDDELVVKTTLVQGAASVSKNKEQRVIVKAGQQAYTIPGSKTLAVKSADTGFETAWMQGLFSFKSTSVAAVMRQLARWYNIEVVYPSGIPDETFTGDLPRTLTLGVALDVLKDIRIHYRLEEGKKLVILP